MNAVNQSVFKDITTRTNPSDYWLNKKLPQNQGQQTLGASQTPDQFIKNIKIITPEEARKTNNIKIIGLSIAGATVATAAAVFAIVRGGGSRKILQFSNQLKLYFEKQLEKAIEVDLNSKNNRKFGQILIDLGFIKEESLKAIILLKDEAKKRFILDYHEVPKSEFAYANMADEYKKKIDDLQTENKNLKAKLNQLLAMVKTNEY